MIFALPPVVLQRKRQPHADLVHIEGAAQRVLHGKGRAVAGIERFCTELRKARKHKIELWAGLKQVKASDKDNRYEHEGAFPL